MCGIAGTYRWPDGKVVTDRLTDTLAHRGPDGSGRYGHPAGDGEVHLGHRRLAIIDLSETGAQPMVSDGLVLTYNGELYNAPELRAELAAAGVRFRGTSDTEVLLEAWRRWGTDCLPRLRGMFAFGIFDSGPASWCSPATSSASSRCSCSGAARAWCSPPSSRRWPPRPADRWRWTMGRWWPRSSTTGYRTRGAPSVRRRSCRRVAGSGAVPTAGWSAAGTGT